MAAVGTRALPEIHPDSAMKLNSSKHATEQDSAKTQGGSTTPRLPTSEQRLLDKPAAVPGSLSPSQRRRILQHVEAVTLSPVARRREGRPVVPDSLA